MRTEQGTLNEMLDRADEKVTRIFHVSNLVKERVDFNDRASVDTQPSIGCAMEIIREIAGELSDIIHEVCSALKAEGTVR